MPSEKARLYPMQTPCSLSTTAGSTPGVPLHTKGEARARSRLYLGKVAFAVQRVPRLPRQFQPYRHGQDFAAHEILSQNLSPVFAQTVLWIDGPAMACSSCVNLTLRSFLQSLDVNLPATARVSNALSIARARNTRFLHTKTTLQNSSTQLHTSRPGFDDEFLPFVDERESPQQPRDEAMKDSQSISKAPANQRRARNTNTGLGPVGQQIKDFQERLSEISGTSRELSSHIEVSPEQKTSRSTPARLARKERRRPRRKFEGDRSRPAERERETTSPNTPRARIVVEPTEEKEEPRPSIEPWGIQKRALREKFAGIGWTPRKRLSPDALEGIRTLHAQHPDTYTTPVLAESFKVSPEAIRRILKSKWRPNDEEEEERKQRWEKRGENIWSQMTELGIKPPKKWRQKGIGRLGDREGGRGGRRVLEDEGGKHSDQGVITTRAVDARALKWSLANKIL